MQKKHAITVDLKGSIYLGLTINWYYDKEYFDISLPNYCSKHYPSLTINSQLIHRMHPISELSQPMAKNTAYCFV